MKNPSVDLGPLEKPWRLNEQPQLVMHLAVLGRLVDRCVARRLTNFDLNLAQWRAIALLKILGESSFGSLAKMAWLDRGDLSRALGRLERTGLVKREANAQDLRSPNFSLTDAGEATYTAFSTDWRGFEDQFQGLFGPAELAPFNLNLERLARECLEILGEI